MKKLILVAAGLSLSIMGMAQKKNVTTAILAMSRNDGDYDEAKKAIDAAVLDESTKDDPKAWEIRGDVYMAMLEKGKLTEAQALDEAAKSYMKVVALKPDYDKDEMNQRLLNIAARYYNIGATDYNDKKYAEAGAALKMLVDIHNLDNGKRFAYNKTIDTMASQSQQVRAYSAYYDNKLDDAATLLEQIKTDPIVKDPNLYLLLIDIYGKQNKEQQMQAAIAEGRKAFPDNTNLRNQELNQYIKSGKQDELVKKLEDAAAVEKDGKTKAEYLYNIGNSYMNMAFPKDANGKDMTKPANYKELVAKAESNYQQALALNADKVDYQYNEGVLYYNQATELNNQMNALGTTAADQKKYDALKADRDGMFKKAVPYLEKAYNMLDANSASLSADDKFTYQSSMIALREIYARTSQKDKVDAMKKKIDEFKSK
ncbi:tetratricopeptide repeat protein [Chitinophagaceae bacterium MMS25-I14]